MFIYLSISHTRVLWTARDITGIKLFNVVGAYHIILVFSKEGLPLTLSHDTDNKNLYNATHNVCINGVGNISIK